MQQLLKVTFPLAKIMCLAMSIVWLFRDDRVASWTGEWLGMFQSNAPGQPLAEQNRLDEAWRALLQSVALKYEIAELLVAGELTLFEAAARLRDAESELPPSFVRQSRAVLQAASDDEYACRKVIAYVRLALEQEPDRAAAFCRQLEAELQRQLRRVRRLQGAGPAERFT